MRIVFGVGCFFVVSVVVYMFFLDCYRNDDDMIICEGGFLDGVLVVGVEICIIDEIDCVVLKGKFDDDVMFMFKEFDFDYYVIFDVGSEYIVVLFGGEIE